MIKRLQLVNARQERHRARLEHKKRQRRMLLGLPPLVD
jgi:hypothetical protein